MLTIANCRIDPQPELVPGETKPYEGNLYAYGFDESRCEESSERLESGILEKPTAEIKIEEHSERLNGVLIVRGPLNPHARPLAGTCWEIFG